MLHSKQIVPRNLSDLPRVVSGAAMIPVMREPGSRVFNEARERRKWAALYNLCRKEELLRERLRLEAEATGLGARFPASEYQRRENALRRQLVADRLDLMGALAD